MDKKREIEIKNDISNEYFEKYRKEVLKDKKGVTAKLLRLKFPTFIFLALTTSLAVRFTIETLAPAVGKTIGAAGFSISYALFIGTRYLVDRKIGKAVNKDIENGVLVARSKKNIDRKLRSLKKKNLIDVRSLYIIKTLEEISDELSELFNKSVSNKIEQDNNISTLPNRKKVKTPNQKNG